MIILLWLTKKFLPLLDFGNFVWCILKCVLGDWDVLVTFSHLCYYKISCHFSIGCFQANGSVYVGLIIIVYQVDLKRYCIQRHFFSPLSPFLSVGEFKTTRIPMSQIIFYLPQLCLGEFKTEFETVCKFRRTKKTRDERKKKPAYSSRQQVSSISTRFRTRWLVQALGMYAQSWLKKCLYIRLLR